MLCMLRINQLLNCSLSITLKAGLEAWPIISRHFPDPCWPVNGKLEVPQLFGALNINNFSTAAVRPVA